MTSSCAGTSTLRLQVGVEHEVQVQEGQGTDLDLTALQAGGAEAGDAAMRPDRAGSRERRVGASLSGRAGVSGGYAAGGTSLAAYRTYAPGVGQDSRRAGGRQEGG